MKLLGGFFGIIFAAIFILAVVSAGPGVWWFDRHFQGYHFAGVPLVHWFSFTLEPGAYVQLASLEAQEAAAQARTVKLVAEQGQITKAASAQETAVQTVIRTRTITLTREVHDVITPAVDQRYPLPNGLIRLYDASALGLDLSAVPNPAGQSDDAASGVNASQAGTVFVANNGTCLGIRSKLVGLQAWIKAEAAAK